MSTNPFSTNRFFTEIDKTKKQNHKSPKNKTKRKKPLKENKKLQNFSPKIEKSLLKVNFELIRDEPVPLFRVQWLPKISLENYFDKIYGKQNFSDFITFPLAKLDEVIDCFKKMRTDKKLKLKLVSLPQFVINSFKNVRFSVNSVFEKKRKIEKIEQKLPETIRKALYPFQKESILFCEEREGRILIGDEMGLGKTIQTIAICAFYKTNWPVLIITPSSLKENWSFELTRWLPELIDKKDIGIVNGPTFAENGNYKFLIVSYNMATKLHEALKEINFDLIVLDECHMLKSKGAMRSKRIVPLAQKAQKCILLSGTATPSRPIELYTQLQCLLPPKKSAKEWFMSRYNYSTRYCDGHKEMRGRMFVWNDKGNSNLTELNIMLNRDVMIRRLKKDALPNLKPKIRKIYRISETLKTTPELLANYAKFDKAKLVKIFSNFNQRFENNSEKEPKLAFKSDTRRQEFARLYQNTGIAKSKAVCAFVARKIERGRKTIVFAHHKIVLDAIEDFLLQREIGYIRIDGKVPITKRFEMVKQFQRFDYCAVALLSISATGIGITLTAAERVIFAELDFVPARLLQCEDRAHRLGQKKTVKIYYILAKKTLDDFVWPMIQRKLQTVSTTLDGIKMTSLKINSSTKFEAGNQIKEKNLDKKVQTKQTEISF